MVNEHSLERWFPFYVGLLGAVASAVMALILVGENGWNGPWDALMFLFVAVAGAGVWMVYKLRPWSGLAFILGGVGTFFSFMLSYAQDPLTLGNMYPLVLFAVAPLCVAGVWLAVEDSEEEEGGSKVSTPR